MLPRHRLLHATVALLITGLAVGIAAASYALRQPQPEPCVVVRMGVERSRDLVRLPGDPIGRHTSTYATVDCRGTVFQVRADAGLP